MDGYAVNFTALQGAAQSFRDTNNAQLTKLRAMMTDVDAAAVNWEGDAKEEWGRVRVTWVAAMGRMSDCLTAADTFLGAAGQQMGLTERNQAARFGA
jgi:WXG100 family type VII secretion target